MSLHRFLFSMLIFFCIAACTEKKVIKEEEKKTVVTDDTIPPKRKNISKQPVATYLVNMGDPRLDRKFGVKIFETPETFKYLLVMYFDGTIQNDTLTIPNFGITPVVKVRPADEKLACIIGFMDKEKEFKEYKRLYAKNDKLKLITLHSYGVATYSK